jgi:uncharacterized membrane protein YGL010W
MESIANQITKAAATNTVDALVTDIFRLGKGVVATIVVYTGGQYFDYVKPWLYDSLIMSL